MAACRVHGIPSAEAVDCAQHVIRFAAGDIVQVQCYKVAPGYVFCFALRTVKRAANKAANVFQLPLLGFGHIQVFFYRFRCSLRRAQPINKL